MKSFAIGGKKIGRDHPTYIIAEMSGNHKQDYSEAEEIVRAAKTAGADAVKLQTYTADTMTLNVRSPLFKISDPGSLWSGNYLYSLYQKAYTPWDWALKLKKLATKLGLDFFSTAFDQTAVDYLEKEVNPPVHKIASFELVDIPLIQKMAHTGKPLIISTGMATLSEIREAVNAARKSGAREIALLKCTSAYPAPPEEMHLKTVPHLLQTFGVPVGISDHTLGWEIPVAGVALGASIIEKHLTLSRKKGAVDAGFSLVPSEFAQMVKSIRITEQAMGKVKYGVKKGEAQMREYGWRRSLFVIRPVKVGEKFTWDNVRSIRPANGLPPRFYQKIIGATATQNIASGTPLSWKFIAKK
ncbi:MAG: N-acetylneuraminate synthase [Candidatus Gottesmanbacteria bacterium GW2011_GWB1_43_11]|uniref:N-acetylneuraminate synthase n=1 Tax=Candidatus Gottesmanbacteria bacterium GW2011_GWB1_43_11 TaxID=1618446 RepID=A0A0G1CPQ2_9BACT|nr:MAG: N-acetylneuraminate synthase [Candidatus Gottesmanbacteria bacterium GW2011_GWA2_42_16]KKS56255.1 MAG: N-acetylneuraminate synthase [Candidatus Gottesmanbacteria bacterium GW2011_GWA1_42_26]KKS82588.1 MAG: N-acetylneuraminate synthase [Candidatus Gottesmanbacteria bacterium GW2011_GWC1_43_10]KKS87457.1 MAG: N-acetylneuraminate synthase [Candidatus Gottesmanbacteria bacterium GW2011_GWB1_43_11]OGG10168.1 MAG: pseudaminic acid synthase [Candidatus Gottesmanbacteria bacterium RIFCSPHIGHO2_